MGKRQTNAEANHEALAAMGWPLAATIIPEFMAGVRGASEIDLRKVLHRMKIENKAYGGQAYRVKTLEDEILRRERAVGTIGMEA